MTYDQHVVAAMRAGARLAEVTSEEENAALQALLTESPAWISTERPGVALTVPESGIELIPNDSFILEMGFDRLNGVDVGGHSDAVSTILVELSQRRTQDQSDAFARLIRREGEGAIRFHPQPRRSAALKVLRAPDVPSVLFESGFITNEDDAARLASAEGQARFAEVMARAIRVYFARQQES